MTELEIARAQFDAQIMEIHEIAAGLAAIAVDHAGRIDSLTAHIARLETRLAVHHATATGRVDGLREEIQGLTRWLL